MSDREFCIRSTAGHEFGHILGARHEQSRSDTPQECFDWLATQGITGQEPNKPLSNVVPSGAPWDINSMMNYCNDAGYKNGFPNFATDNKLVWNNGGLFSPRDLLGFQNIYSRFKLEGYTTGLNASPGSEFGFEKGSNPFYPDLLQTTARRPSGSGFVEVHSMTYDSQYKIFNRHIATSLRIPTSQDFYGFSFTDWDKDGKADMVYMVSNGASGRLELHVMSGSSNFQSYLLQTSVAVMNSRDYKFAFGNYYGSGRPDLYIFQKWANSTYLIILSASSNYQNSIFGGYLNLNYSEFDACNFGLGNYYNNTSLYKLDVVCLHAPKVSRTDISVIAFKTPDYVNRVNVRSQLFSAEDGVNTGFLSWPAGINTDDSSGTTNTKSFPGKGMVLGFVKKNISPIEVHLVDASMHF